MITSSSEMEGQTAPQISARETESLCAAWFDEEVRATPLYGEYDRNFRVETSDGRRFVFKWMRDASEDTRSLVGLQVAMLQHLAECRLEIECPRPLASITGEYSMIARGPSGSEHVAWMLGYIGGQLLDDCAPYSDALLRSIGRSVAVVDRALLDFSDPRADRELLWDVTRAARLSGLTEYVKDKGRRRIVDHFFLRLGAEVLPRLRERPMSVIHNDGGNQHNVIVGDGGDGAERVVGIIDFGDSVETRTICGLGIAAAYATFGCDDPVEAVARVAAGYHGILPLDDADLDLVIGLAATRLAMTVSIAAQREAVDPDNEYALVSAAHAWRSLERLYSTDSHVARAVIRELVHAGE